MTGGPTTRVHMPVATERRISCKTQAGIGAALSPNASWRASNKRWWRTFLPLSHAAYPSSLELNTPSRSMMRFCRASISRTGSLSGTRCSRLFLLRCFASVHIARSSFSSDQRNPPGCGPSLPGQHQELADIAESVGLQRLPDLGQFAKRQHSVASVFASLDGVGDRVGLRLLACSR